MGAAGYGPRALGVEIAMPVQCPKLFEADLPDVEIKKYRVYVAVVPIDAYQVHLVLNQAINLRRTLCMRRPRVPDYTIEEHRYVVCLLLLSMSPILISGAVSEKFIHAVTAVI